MKTIKLTSACNIVTGKLDSNAAVENGKYPYFTCAPEPLRIDTYAFDEDAILLAGNNASGNFHCQRYDGKFNAYQRTYVITAKRGYNIDFIYYSLLINLQLFRKIAQGSQTKFLTMEILNGFELDDLTYEKQVKLATVMKEIDSKIANNNAICSNLEGISKLLYDYWFVQFDFPDENGKPYKSSGGKMVWNEDLKREIPAGWYVGTFDDCITSINTGLNPRDNFKLNTGGTIRYLTVKNLTTDGTIDFSSCDMIDEDARRIVHRRSDISVGDVLFASIAPLGRCCIITNEPKDWDINESVFSIRPNYENVTSIFLYMTFMSEFFIKKAEGSSVGSVFKGIRISELQDLQTVIPPKDILDKYDTQVSRLFQMKANVIEETQQHASLRDFLLPMLMNSQVKIKNDEA